MITDHNEGVSHEMTLTKVCTYVDNHVAKSVESNLKRLKTDFFNRIKVPNFIFARVNNIIQIEMEFIPGLPLRKNDLLGDEQMQKVIYEDLILDREYSFTDFKPHNFLVPKHDCHDFYLYYVDLVKYNNWLTEEERIEHLHSIF